MTPSRSDTDTGAIAAGCVDVVIVNFNAAGHLDACLASVMGAGGVNSVTVVDNASTDRSAAIVSGHPGVRWLPTGANLGFGRAANRGVAATSAPLVLVLNPDAVVLPGAVEILAATLGVRTRCAAIGPRVENPDGTLYPSARAFPNLVDAIGHGFVGLLRPDNRWSRRYLAGDRVDWVSGTAVLVRRGAFEAVGGFDEDYFMYVEDVDLCWRLRDAGWDVHYEPAAGVVHVIGGSSEGRALRMIAAHHRSLWRFAARTTIGPQRLMLPLVAVGLVVRAVGAGLKRAVRHKSPAVR